MRDRKFATLPARRALPLGEANPSFHLRQGYDLTSWRIGHVLSVIRFKQPSPKLKRARCTHSCIASLAAMAVRLGPFYACRAVVFAKAGRSSHSLHSPKSPMT